MRSELAWPNGSARSARIFTGEYGSQFLAEALEIPLQTWMNYESGIVVPDYVVPELLVLSCVNLRWLLTGEGEKDDHRLRQGAGQRVP